MSIVECTAIESEGRLDPTTCAGCEECADQIYDDMNSAVEMGDIDPEDAEEQLLQFEQFGVIPG